ncbi:hypothetical protein, partial [Plasmodium yoelii yoelii]
MMKKYRIINIILLGSVNSNIATLKKHQAKIITFHLIFCAYNFNLITSLIYNGTISAINKNPLNQCTIFHSFI